MGTQARELTLPSLHRLLPPSVKSCAMYGERLPESGSREGGEGPCENPPFIAFPCPAALDLTRGASGDVLAEVGGVGVPTATPLAMALLINTLTWPCVDVTWSARLARAV